MQALRIAVGLFVLVTIFFLFVPAEPTLFAARAPVSVETAPRTVAKGSEPQAVQTVAGQDPVRIIGPAIPVGRTALTRLAPVSSGAATPTRAGEPQTPSDEASPSTPETTLAQAASGEDAGETAAEPGEDPAVPPGPDLRLFARPIAVDSRTLKAGEITLRVAGVEPIDPEARCIDGRQAWPCATRARTALRGWLRGRSVLCAVPPEAGDSREITAPCLLGEDDVGEWVVSNGWARAQPGSRYEDAERAAREAGRGVWAYGMADTGSNTSASPGTVASGG